MDVFFRDWPLLCNFPRVNTTLLENPLDSAFSVGQYDSAVKEISLFTL